MLLTIILSGFIAAFGQAALISTAGAHREGVRTGFWETLRPAFVRLPALFVMGLLLPIGVLLGFLLLIVPGFILMVTWSVVFPVAIIERTGILESVRRSSQLTVGVRWRILFLLIAANMITILFSLAGKGVVALFVGGFGESTGPGSFAALTVIDMLTDTVGLAVPCILYIHLAERHGGPTSDRLTRIFE